MKPADNIRILCAEMVQKAKSGHPGAPLGLATFVYTLYSEFLNLNPEDDKWINRDIFILSNGHACSLQYTMNYLMGYLTLDDLKSFRQLDSRTPGHPEGHLPGIECTTGPLGQGVANAVGMAISLKKLHELELTSKVYCIFGDGCYQEGVGQEAFSIAANLRLDNLVFIYDFNQITIDGPTSISMNENVVKRFESLGFEIDEVDGENVSQIRKALSRSAPCPHVIILKTKIGRGSHLEGTAGVHGSPLGEEGLAELKKNLNAPPEDFHVGSELLDGFLSGKTRMSKFKAEWDEKFQRLVETGSVPDYLLKRLKVRKTVLGSESDKIFTAAYEKQGPKATRKHFSEALNALKDTRLMISGSADLAASCLTKIKGMSDFNGNNISGSYINYGIREHAMFGILNGIAAHGYYLPFSSTFLNFVSYGYPSVRLASMDKLNVFYVLTHDSIGLGEDGPTHQPIETLATLRATENLITMRPCDGVECRAALRICLMKQGPKAIILSRQNVQDHDETTEDGAMKGAYYLVEQETPDLILFGTGSEIDLCYEIATELSEFKVSIVSFFSWELFEEQSLQYRSKILKAVPKISVEALSTFGWAKYADMSIGMDSYGASAPYSSLKERYGFGAQAAGVKIRDFMKKRK